jgi:hypothetical protein
MVGALLLPQLHSFVMLVSVVLLTNWKKCIINRSKCLEDKKVLVLPQEHNPAM